jgi:hypothetical protein
MNISTHNLTNPFKFEYDEITDTIITKSNLKFFRNCQDLDKKYQYVKINFTVYKIKKAVDYFTWLNEPDSETNYQIELYFQIEEKNHNDSWFNHWYLNSRFSTGKINLYDTYIPTTIEYIRFI